MSVHSCELGKWLIWNLSSAVKRLFPEDSMFQSLLRNHETLLQRRNEMGKTYQNWLQKIYFYNSNKYSRKLVTPHSNKYLTFQSRIFIFKKREWREILISFYCRLNCHLCPSGLRVATIFFIFQVRAKALTRIELWWHLFEIPAILFCTDIASLSCHMGYTPTLPGGRQ